VRRAYPTYIPSFHARAVQPYFWQGGG